MPVSNRVNSLPTNFIASPKLTSVVCRSRRCFHVRQRRVASGSSTLMMMSHNRIFAISEVEGAAASHRNAKRLEVVGADDVRLKEHTRAFFFCTLSFRVDASRKATE